MTPATSTRPPPRKADAAINEMEAASIDDGNNLNHRSPSTAT